MSRIAFIKTVRKQVTYCPVCLQSHYAVTGIQLDDDLGMVPMPGAYTMCDGCGALLQFDGQMQERAVTPEAEAEYLAELEPGLRKLFEARRAQIRGDVQ